jgi:cytoskeletal protein CcmA (bactofilin family)
MALWKESPTPGTPGSPAPQPAAASRPEPSTPVERAPPPPSASAAASESPSAPVARRPQPRAQEGGESVIAANLTIEGKIEGTGNVRIAGRFKGDVRIDGNFTIDSGAQLTGQVLAGIVVVGGELQGNIENARRVDVLEGGVVVGDVKAGSITVAAGSRMRGHVEFGWDENEKANVKKMSNG